ncbi:MAG: IS110 family transposase [Solirubrobacterales bacterium]
MEELVDRCAGIDVGQAEVVVCVRVPDRVTGRPAELIETYGTTTPDLMELRDWMAGLGVTHVVMESTGVYWKPVYYLLEDDFVVMLVNAAHVKHVPGRKTDTIDAVWLAQLLAHGLLSASFVPPKPIRELRDLTRYRKALINERAASANRVHKVLEDAGVKINTFASDVFGVSGRAMMRALIAGHDDPAAMADLAQRRMRSKIPDLTKALTGRFGPHHAFLLERMLDHIEAQEADIAALDERIAAVLDPLADRIELLRSIPGVDRRSAEVILAEIGPDMSVFPTAAHLASWAGMCPGQRDSAGKRGSGKTRKGSKWLRATLVQSARAATRSKGTYLRERYLHIRRRRGDAKAVVAVGHEILLAAYRILETGVPYIDPGPGTFNARTAERERRRAVENLRRLGFEVALTPTAA